MQKENGQGQEKIENMLNKISYGNEDDLYTGS